ncbi:MAG: hypothetical protein RLZZ282_1636 [Verrucomicrobiota bacterium]
MNLGSAEVRRPLEVALEAERRIALSEHFLVHGAVWAVTGGATVAGCLVFEHKRSALLGVTIEAGFILARDRHAAALVSRAFVRVMAVTAGHLAGEHGVAVGQHELGFFVEVALEAGFRGFFGIDDGASAAAGFFVFAARAVAGFAAHIDGVSALRLEFGMVGGAEIAADFFVAIGAFFRADEGGPRDGVWGDHHGAGGRAGDENQREGCPGTGTP